MTENNNYTVDCGIGILAGCATKASLRTCGGKIAGKQLIKGLQKITQAENDEFLKGALQAYNNSELIQKGVKIHHVDQNNVGTVVDNILQSTKLNSNNGNKLKKAINEFYAKKIERGFQAIANGFNACHMPKTKGIYVNKDKMAFSIFHEMGHAINANCKDWRKVLQKIKLPSKAIGGLAFATALFTNRKAKNDPTRDNIDKTTDFVKDNCGKIVFISILPTLAEEAMASINGAKMAKKVLNNDMLKKLNKLNFKAWGTYLTGAVVAGVGSALAVYIKDKVAGNKPMKARPIYTFTPQPQYAYYQQPAYRA